MNHDGNSSPVRPLLTPHTSRSISAVCKRNGPRNGSRTCGINSFRGIGLRGQAFNAVESFGVQESTRFSKISTAGFWNNEVMLDMLTFGRLRFVHTLVGGKDDERNECLPNGFCKEGVSSSAGTHPSSKCFFDSADHNMEMACSSMSHEESFRRNWMPNLTRSSWA